MKNKITLFFVVLLVVAIVGLGIVLGLVFKDVNQRNQLVSQINTVIEQKMSNDDIVLTGEYGKIEKQVKEDYKTYFEAINTIQTNNNAVENLKVKNIENFQNDGPEFTNSLDTLNSMKSSNEEKILTLKYLVSEDEMKARAEAAGLAGKYKDLYFQIIADAKLSDNVAASVAAAEQMNDYYAKLITLLTYMKDNKAEWFIENGTLKSKSQSFIDEYNRLLQEATVDSNYNRDDQQPQSQEQVQE